MLHILHRLSNHFSEICLFQGGEADSSEDSEPGPTDEASTAK